MAKKIMTVCGPIFPIDLGFTSMHEHVLSDCSMFRSRLRKGNFLPKRYFSTLEGSLNLENRSSIRHDILLSVDNMKLDKEEVMTAEVADFKARGGHSILEVSAPGIRSSWDDLLAFKRISQATGVHIVASTGLYAEDTWPLVYRSMTYKTFVRFLYQEITHGIGNTGIFPGHIKAAYEAPSKELDIYLQAAATVAGETGIPLQVHLGTEVTAEEVRQHVLPPLLRGGCIPEKTILCHVQFLMGVLAIKTLVSEPGQIPFSIEFHKELLDQGFILAFTPVGFEADNESLGIAHYPDWYSLAGIVALIQAGYAGQLVLGNDVFTKLATRRGGGDGYNRLLDFILPALEQCGVSKEDCNQLFIENPARILAF